MKKQTKARCLLCHTDQMHQKSIHRYFFSDDCLCDNCRAMFPIRRVVIKYKGMKIESFYLYDERFSQLLLQYKEAHDEALYEVFLQPFKHYLNWRYRGYTIVLAPSSASQIEKRGFEHLEKMVQNQKLKYKSCFVKIKDIKQANQTRSQRKDIGKYIKLRDNTTLPKKVLLFDDVLTTGSTIDTLYNLMKGTKVTIKIVTCSYNKEWCNVKNKGIIFARRS